LALQVAAIDEIEIDEPEGPDTSGGEDIDELVSQAVSGIWKLVRQALEARLKRIERRKSQQPEDISSSIGDNGFGMTLSAVNT